MPTKKKPPEKLLQELVDAGEWPEPKTLQAIVAHGETALPAVLAHLRQRIDQPDPTRGHLLGLLTLLPGGQAVAELIGLLEKGQTEELLARAIVAQGNAAVEPLLRLVQSPHLPWYDRGLAGQLALACADDPEPVCVVLRELLRSLLTGKNKKTPEERGLIASLVLDLAQLPDRTAESLLRQAVQAGLGDLTSPRELDVLLNAPPAPPEPPLNWIEEYEERYAERQPE